MPYGELTVGDLRNILIGLPDDSPICIRPYNQQDWSSCDAYKTRDYATDTYVTIQARPARPWNYKTRTVHNAYTANDDRFDQNQILLIEIGEEIP